MNGILWAFATVQFMLVTPVLLAVWATYSRRTRDID